MWKISTSKACYIQNDKVATRSIRPAIVRHSFEEFVRIVADVPDRQADRHSRSQHSFLNSNGTCIADYVGKMESLNEDWQTLSNRFGFPSLPHNNQSLKNPTDPRQFDTWETLTIAAERYRRDDEQFGYSPEP